MAKIVFVDEDDKIIGSGTRKEALEKGIIHRIVQTFLVNSKGELLIQKRADILLSSPGKWDASSAGHVDEGEEYIEAATREMQEEIGVQNILLKKLKKIRTEEGLETGIQKRFCMLYTASYNGEIKFNREEVSEVMWIQPKDLETWMARQSKDFAKGFLVSFKEFSRLTA